MKKGFVLIILMLMASTAWAQIEEPSSAAQDLKSGLNCTVNGIDQRVKTEAECTTLGGSISLVPTAATR